MKRFILAAGIAALFLTPTVSAQLNGLYFINPLAPGGGGNYASLSAAVADLMAQGVSGPCTFEIYDDAGPFTVGMPFVSSNVGWTPSTAILTLGQWPGASAANRVTFKAAIGEFPVFDASGAGMGVFWNGADYATIEGIEIANAPFDGVSLYSEAQHGQALDPIIRRCNIHDCAAAGIVIYGNSARPQNTLVENNFLWNLQSSNSGGFNTLARFGYVSGRRHDNSRVINNTFYVSTSAGSAFAVIGDVPSGGTNSHFLEVSNNIIVKTTNATRPIFSFPLVGTTGIPAIVDANCIWDTSGGPFSAGEVVAANLAAWQTATTRSANSFELDPLLAAPATGDLHLTAASPCINGSAVPSGVTDDFDGDPRTGIADVGADEFGTPCMSAEYQVNSAASTLNLSGVVGTACMPAITTVTTGSAVTIAFNSTQIGFGWELILVPSGLISATSGALVTSNGQIINVDVNTPGTSYLWGNLTPDFTNLFPGNFNNVPFTAPGAPQILSTQMAHLDPTHPDGVAVSQGCQLDVL